MQGEKGDVALKEKDSSADLPPSDDGGTAVPSVELELPNPGQESSQADSGTPPRHNGPTNKHVRMLL